MILTGKCSVFGGPNDDGMKITEGLALYEHHEADQRKDLFFPRDANQDIGTSKRLRPQSFYIALRYHGLAAKTRRQWQATVFVIRNPRTGTQVKASLVDWGPAEWTGRLVDMSPGVAKALEVQTDDEVFVEMAEPNS